MNREVEERIVAMYFDNQDFEKNAKQTIDTLGQLKEGLNLEDSAKGFKVFDKIKDALNMDKANRGAQKLRGTLTSLSNTLGKAMNIGEAPVRALDNVFGTFRSYLTKFIGFDLAGKIVNTVESTMRSLTIAPISAGWDMYQTKMDSVKTIMSGTGESIEVVEEHLKNLSDYAEKTIYSLSDMTSNIGKFTNNGIELKEATTAMIGIANATADAGQGAQSASMAMYNLSQAMGVGKMTTIDWKSLENANIATQRLKNTFLEVAAASGRLEKETDGKGVMHFFLSKDEDGKALKERVELTAANFREYLQKGWLDKDTMLRTFMLYSGQGITADTLKTWGIDSEEDQQRLMDIGKEALAAAQEVRTFSKMMDALKESVQSGWADSFQKIFGNMEEGTTLWTDINKRLDSVLSASANNRNKILQEWVDMSADYGSVFREYGKHGEKLKSLDGGRDILVKSFFEMMDVVMNFGKVISDAFHKVFGSLDAKKLMDITLGFRDLVSGVKEWLGNINNANSRISKISKIMTGFFSIVKVGFNIIKTGFNLIKRIAGPVIDYFLDTFSVVGEFLTGAGDLNFGQLFAKIGEGFQKLWGKIKELFTPKEIAGGGKEMPIITWIKERWQALKTVIRQWANDSGLGEILSGFTGFVGTILHWDGWDRIAKFFTDAKDTIVQAWEAVKNWKVWTSIGNFLTDTWNWVLEILGIKQKEANPELEKSKENLVEQLSMTDEFKDVAPKDQGFFSGIINSLTEAWNAIKGTWDSTIGSEDAKNNLWKPIANFFTDTWKWICGVADTVTTFFTKPDEDTGETGFVSWIRGVWESVEKFWNETIMGTARPLWEKIAKFASDTWGWISSQFVAKKYDDRGFELNNPQAPIVTWLSDIWGSIEKFWNETIMGTARPLWEKIAKFASDTWGWISSQFVAKKYDDRGFELNNPQAPIVTWLSGIWDKVKGVWNDVVAWEGWQAIGEFLGNTWGWITGLFNSSETSTAGASEQSVKMAENNAKTIEEATKKSGFLESTIDAVGKFFERILGAVTETVIPEGVTDFLKNMTGMVGQMLGFIGDLMGTIGRIIEAIRTGDKSKMTQGDWTAVFVAVLGGVATIVLKMLNNKWLSKIGDTQAQSIGLQLLEFGGGLMLISSALALLSTLDVEKMKNGALVLSGLVVAFGAIVYTMSLVKSNKQTKEISGVERFFTNLVNQAAKFAIISVLVKSLPSIIEAIGEAKKGGAGSVGEDFLKVAEGVAILFGTISIILAATQKLSGAKGLDPKAALSTTLAISLSIGAIGAIFSFIGGLPEVFKLIGVDDIQSQGLKNLDNATETMVKFGESIGRFFGAIVGAFTGQKDASNLNATAQGLSDASQIAETITEDQMNHLTMVMSMMGTLQDSLPGYKDVWDKWLNGNKLAELGNQLPALGKGLSEFSSYVQSLTPEDMTNLIDSGRVLGQFANAMALVADAFTTTQSSVFGGAIWDKAVFQQYQEAATQLADALRKGLSNEQGEMSGLEFNAMPVIDAIINALKLGETAIGHAVRDMVQAGLNMVDADRGTYSELRVPQEVSDALANAGKLKNEEGESFTITDVLSDFLGDEGEYNALMKTFDDKTGALEEKMGSLMGTFAGSDWLDFKDEEGNDVDIIGTLQGHLDSLGETLNNMDPLKVTITPVFDMTNFTPEALQTQLDNMPIQFTQGTTPNHMTIEFKGLGEELNIAEVINKLEQIRSGVAVWGLQNVTATNRLGVDIDGVANEISRMKLYLDTGALVGGILPMIDAGLYKRSVTASRTGTVSMN